MRSSGRIIVIERLLGEIGELGLSPLSDLNMMVMLAGRERTLAEYRVLLKDSGLGPPALQEHSDPLADGGD
jgi:hypothetical protein